MTVRPVRRVLNIGCGNFPFTDTKNTAYWNMDILNLSAKAVGQSTYIRHNILRVPYPFPDATFDEIWASHVIEHISKASHDVVIRELHRLLAMGGKLKFIYPEFKICAVRYINNYENRAEFWEACIYGRSGKGGYDEHKALMDTNKFMEFLLPLGFDMVKATTDRVEDYNTVLECKKVEPQRTYEELLGKLVIAGQV